MNCREVCNKMFDYIEHQLSQQEIKEFEEHMKDCKNCQDEYYKLEKLIVKLKNIKDIEPPNNLKYKILENIKSEIKEQNKKSNIIYFKKYSYIAATMILFVGGFYTLKAIENSPVKNDIYNVTVIDNYSTTESESNIIEKNTETTTENINETTTIIEKEIKTSKKNIEITTEITTIQETENKLETNTIINEEELSTINQNNNSDININENKDIDTAKANLQDATPDLKIKEAEIFNNSRILQPNINNNFYYEKTITKDTNMEIFKYDIALYKNQTCNVYFENNSEQKAYIYIENIDGKKVSQDTIVEKKSNNSMEFYMTEEEIEQDVYTINIKAEDKNFIDGYLKIEIPPKEN